MATTLGTAYVQILPSTQGIKGQLEDAFRSASSSAGKVGGDAAGGSFASSLGGALKAGVGGALKGGLTAIAGGLTATTGAMAGFSTAAVNVGTSFDSAMSQVYATMGKTSQEALSNTETVELAWGSFSGNLREYAQEIGANTMFSASQAAEGLNYMALAGYSAKDSMEMLPTVMNLAAAGSIELGAASDMVTDAQSALGLSMEETVTMVDQMAKTSSTTNTSVAQLGDAILRMGGTARNLKGGTGELTQVLGLLADNGIKAAEGGTHLRNIMMSMVPNTDAAAAAFERLGLTTYDESGSLRSMEDIFLDLSNALDSMTDLERENALNAIFNKTDIAAVNALLNTSKDRWDEVAGAIEGAGGSAASMANIQMDNLSGDMQLWGSAVEAAQIAVSEQLTPTLREFVQLGTEGISELTKAFKDGGLDGAVNAFSGWFGKASKTIAGMLPGMVDTGAKLFGALIRGLSDSLPQLTSTAIDIGETLFGAIVDNAPLLLDAAASAISNFSTGIGGALPELIPQGVDMVLSLVEGVGENIPAMVDAAGDLIGGLVEGIVSSLPLLVERGPEIITGLVGSLTASLPEMVASGGELLSSLGDGLQAAFPALVEAIPGLVSMLVNGIITFIPLAVEGLRAGLPQFLSMATEMLTSLADGLIASIPVILDALPEIIGSIVGFLADALPQIVTAGFDLLCGIVGNLPEILLKLAEAGGEIIASLVDEIGKGFPKIAQAGMELLKGIGANLSEVLSHLGEKVHEIVGHIAQGIRDGWSQVKDAGKMMIQGLADGLVDGAANAVNRAKEIAADVLGAIKGFFGIASPSKVLYAIGQYLDLGLAGGIGDFAKAPIKSVMDLGQDIMDAFNPSLAYQDIGFDVRPGQVITKDYYDASSPYMAHDKDADSPKVLNVEFVLGREKLGKVVYELVQEEMQRVGLRYGYGGVV